MGKVGVGENRLLPSQDTIVGVSDPANDAKLP